MPQNAVVPHESWTRLLPPPSSGPQLKNVPSPKGARAPDEPRETPVEPWRSLVRRRHPWREQLYIKGRNLTARQLVGGIKANRLDEEKAADNYDLPVEAVREALAYVAENKELLEIEAEIERLMLKRGGVARGPQTVSG